MWSTWVCMDHLGLASLPLANSYVLLLEASPRVRREHNPSGRGPCIRAPLSRWTMTVGDALSLGSGWPGAVPQSRIFQTCVPSFVGRNLARQQQQQASWLQKRRQENAQRRAAGEEPLPEEDPVQFKPIPEPNHLESFLITNQISNYCEQINGISAQALEKLYLMEKLQV
jgi:C-terminal region of eIF3h